MENKNQLFNGNEGSSKLLSSDFDHVKHLDVFLPKVVAKHGTKNVLNQIEEQLTDPRFKVDFTYDDTKEILESYRFDIIALFYHDFIIPKPVRVPEAIEKVKEVFDVMEFTENDDTLTFSVYLWEGPYANTIEEAAMNINVYLAPVVKKLTEQLGITDYSMIFNITAI